MYRSPRIVRRNAAPVTALPVSPLLQRIYAARNLHSPQQLHHSLNLLTLPDQLLGMERAVELLETALRERWRILIIADFDADGATSCALAMRALRIFGAAWVDYRVPNRFLHSYGLTPEIVAVAAEAQPDLLITVDNGISSHEGVDAAHALGIKVLITDHHVPGQTLPAADAIINPNQHGDCFPSKHLAGVGVIFYVLLALRSRLRASDWFAERGIAEPNMAQFLDLVALGTVADVVLLDHHNRILVAQGLQRIRKGECVAGITALCTVTERNQKCLSTNDIGFYLGPRLNAAGRLADMSQGIACLLTDDVAEAQAGARRLHEINKQRRQITQDTEIQALHRIELVTSSTTLPAGVCLFDPEWHQGIVGIIAGRLKERLHRPVIVFANDRDGFIKGSGRSIAGMHLRDALATIATQNHGLINHFGGHAMAAGLTLRAADFPRFAEAFDAQARHCLNAEDLQECLLSDGELAAHEFAMETAECLEQGGPWGQGFPEPLFDGLFTVRSHQVMKGEHVKLWLQPLDADSSIEAVFFKPGEDVMSAIADAQRVHIAYRLEINRWQGNARLQLLIVHLQVL